MDLATIDDVLAVRELSPEQESTALALISKASARVSGYTGQKFDYVEDDVVRVRSRYMPRAGGYVIRLPQWPVVSVTDVTALSQHSVPPVLTEYGVTGWQWYAGQIIECVPSDGWYQVTYSHGLQTPHPLLAEVVVDMVLRAMFRPSEIGVRSQLVGSAQEMYAGEVVDAPTVKLTADDKATLKPFQIPRGGNARVM